MIRKLTKNNIRKNKLIPFILLVSLIILISFVKLFHPITRTNLIKFHSLTAEDPLFYDPNTDLSHLRTSTQDLKSKDEQIVSANESYRESQISYNNWDVFPKDWEIWPDRFLTMLPAVHEITTDFLSKPTPEKAIKLLESYTQTVKQYRTSIDLQIQALETFLDRSPEDRTKKILFLGSATTPEIAHNDFLLIRKNAQALEIEVSERKECLYEGVCLPIKMKNQELAQDAAITVPFKPLSDSILGIDRNKDAVFGPFNIPTGCFGFTQDQKTYNLPFFMVENKDGLIPMTTNTKYYRDYRTVPEQPVAQIWLKHGFSLRPKEALSDYLCTDLRYIPQLFLDYLKEKQKDKNSLSNESLFGVLPYLIDRTAMFSQIMALEMAYDKKPYNPLYLLIDRSAYSLYFGTFTSRIWRISESPTFLIKKDFSDVIFRAGYVKYEDLVAEGVSEEKIIGLNAIPNIMEVYKTELQEATQSGQKNESIF